MKIFRPKLVDGFFAPLFNLCINLALPALIFASFFGVATLKSQSITVSLSAPVQVSRCGPIFTTSVTVSNTTGRPITDIEGSFNLPTGVFLESVMAPATLVGSDIQIGSLNSGEDVTFNTTFQVGCSFGALGFNVDFEATGDTTNTTTGDVGPVFGDEQSNTVEVVFADLSMPSSNPATLGVYLGLVDDVDVSIVNNGFGEVEMITYCVVNSLSNLDLQAITVGGIDITAGGPVFTQAGQDCYTVSNAAIQGAGLGATFSQGESIVATETWEVVACANRPADITRRVQYGCQNDDDCQEKPVGDFVTTGVSYTLLVPDVDAEVVSTVNPACYMTENTEVVIRLTNNGTAPAQNIRFRLSTDNNRGSSIDLNGISVTDNAGANPFTDITLSNSLSGNSCNGPDAVRRVDAQLDQINLGIGESILVTYALTTSCDCNDCDIRNKYWNRFQLRGYDDLCDEDLDDFQDIDPSGRFDAFITGVVEGPTSLFSAQEGCLSYFITDMQLDWMTNNYPNAYLEATFTIPCGLDYVPSTMVWTDRDGQVYPIDAGDLNYVDNPGMADDELSVRYLSPNRPGGFNYAGGGSFDFCVVADCSEKPNLTCGTAYVDVDIEAQFDFTTDPNCPSDCAIQKIWKPENLQVRVVCPSTDVNCMCDGITFNSFDVRRTNFGLADANNDQIPDGPLADPATAQTDRFLQGDSLRATFVGTVRDVNDSRDFDFGFIEFPLDHSNFTPLGASVMITDASTGVVYNCGGVPITPDYTLNRIVVDFSRDALNTFGCGLPANFLFSDGDGVEVVFDFVEKELLGANQFRIVDYEPRFYVSEEGFGLGVRYQCNPLLARMTQVGFSTDRGFTGGDFGSCDLPNFNIRYDHYIGGFRVDEFPNEIRPIGIPDRFVFTKPSAFNHRIDAWGITLQQNINPSNNIVNSNNIPAQYFLINGDEVTFLIQDYLLSLNNIEIQPDEGYRINIRPRFQGGCESVVAEYDYSYFLVEDVDENIFCVDEITSDVSNRSFTYQGAARLVVLADQANIRLCSGDEQATIRVRNVESSTAVNSFLYPDPTGSVTINRIEDANTGLEIVPNQFGIYELGNIGGNSERELIAFFTKNDCDDVEFDFVGGWDCNGYPETINDAICRDVSSISLTNASSSLGLLVTTPPNNSTQLIDLCEDVPFEANILSSDLGFVRDLFLSFTLPPNLAFEPGSFMIAVPATSLGGAFVATADPVSVGGNQYEIDIASLDPTLAANGLVGSKDVDNSVMSIRFNATTECGYLSGERARFVIQGNNSCGDPLPPVIRRSGRIRTADTDEDIVLEVQPNTLSLNPCSGESETLNIKATLGGGPITNVDSIRVLLPTGVVYVPDSYVPGLNAPAGNNPPVIRDLNGQTGLFFPFGGTTGAGNMLLFDIDVMAVDAGQICGDFSIAVDAFAAFDDLCNGVVCQSSAIRGSDQATVTIQKPDIEVVSIDGSITLSPGSGDAVADFTTTVTNLGFPMANGNRLTVGIYEDVNMNGSLDIGTDEFLFPLDTLLVNPLNTGQSITISGMSTFPAAGVCNVIGVIQPDSSCVCTTRPSQIFRPEIIFDIQDEYEVCSGEQITSFGPAAIPGFDFSWFSIGGSNLDFVSPTTGTPTMFNAPVNNTGAPIILQYGLRAANAPCFNDNIVNVTILPLVAEEVNVQACLNSSYTLPTVDFIEATNFAWQPSAGLTISGDGRIATVDNVTASQTYTLTYSLGAGCDAALIVNLTAIDCGTSNTQVGDFVWFDFNEDGFQDPLEPGVAGVTVFLINANTGAVISTAVTDVDGMYLFQNLPAGNYAVQVVPPAGFLFTSNDQAGDDAMDSDVDPTTGITPGSFVPLGMANLDFDAGLIPDCNLELNFTVGDCLPVSGSLMRRIQLHASWTGNPYTYDQFGDGNDTLDVTIGANSYAIVVADLMGSTVVFDSLIDPAVATTFMINAAFRESTTCTAVVADGPYPSCSYDLALVKTASTINPTPGPYVYGDLVCMDITVTNQGELPVQNIQIYDTMPAGLAFNAAESDLGWININPLQLFILSAPLLPGETRTRTICANVLPNGGSAAAYTNIAEIGSFEDTNGNDLSAFDDDSTPDQNFSNDPGGEPNSATDNITNGDPSDPGAPNDEDDSDPFLVPIYDLALTKVLTTPPPYRVGDVLTYTIQVVNQGSEPAAGIIISDYIPTGMSYAASNTGTWTAPVSDATTTVTPLSLAAGASTTVTIDLVLDGVSGQSTYVNRAEISADDGDDVDSVADNLPDNDPGGAPDSPADNTVNGNGTGSVNDAIAATDSDDADPAILVLDTVSVGSTVFLDPDDNGMQELTGPMAEAGIPGVSLSIFLDSNQDGVLTGAELIAVATTMTGANGAYYFGELLPGFYQVKVDMSNFDLPGGVLSGLATSSTDIGSSGTDNATDGDDNGMQPGGAFTVVSSPFFELLPGTEEINEPGTNGDQEATNGNLDANGNMTIDFGFIPNVAIGSTVFYDLNNNGIQDPGENGIEGVIVELLYDANGNGVIDGTETTPTSSIPTGPNGEYIFADLADGNYVVQIPASNFSGGSLDTALTSSTDIATTVGDNMTDGDDNGQQVGGAGTLVTSSIINLMAGMEPMNGAPDNEDGTNSNLDNGFDQSGDMTIDFGFAPNLSIGSTVFLDLDLSSTQNGSETGIDDVIVELYFDADGSGAIDTPAEMIRIAMTVTTNGGDYFFDNLPPGNYQVEIPEINFLPGGALFDSQASSSDLASTLLDGQVDSDDNGLQDSTGTRVVSPIINLALNMEPTNAVEEMGQGNDQDDDLDSYGDMTVDFGFQPNVSIGSTVFLDPDDSGTQVGEPGVAGVFMELFYDANGSGSLDTPEELLAVAFDTTGSNGEYFFGNLAPGSYQVQVSMGNFTGGVLSGFGTSSTDDLLNPAGDDQVDEDDNGSQPGGQLTVVFSPFISLIPGQEPPGETGTNGTQDVDSGGVDENGDMTVDFGFLPNVSIGSTVYYDPNNNGMQDPGENGIAGVTVELYFDINGDMMLTGVEINPVATTVTGPTGNYSFGDLPSGSYQVQIPASNFGMNMPLDTVQTSSGPTNTTDSEIDGDDNGIQAGGFGTTVVSPFIDLQSGMEPTNDDDDETGQGTELDNGFDASGDMTIDFGFQPNVSIGSTVFFDADNNGMQDGTEMGIGGVTLFLLYDANNDGALTGTELTTPFTTVMTDANGDYLFAGLVPGNYQVQIPATNFDLGMPLDTALASSTDIATSQVDNQTDGDDNGIQLNGYGTVVNSPLISLLAGEEPVAMETEQGADQDMATDASGDMTVDFGFAPNVSIGSTVFLDGNNSGTQDGLEAGIPNVTVELYFDADGNGVLENAELTPVGTMNTNSDGNYYFNNLPPGVYQVQLPASNFMGTGGLVNAVTSSQDLVSSTVDGQVDSDDNGLQAGGASTIVTSPFITLIAGDEPLGTQESGQGNDQDDLYDSSGDMTVDFGFQPNVAIGSTVFVDPNNNGLQDPGETGISSVVVELYYDANGNGALEGAEFTPVEMTTTDPDGNYFFQDLVPGNYQVQIPASNFMLGALDTVLTSSTDLLSTPIDGQVDGDDNGIQAGGAGTTVVSPFINLMAGGEPTLNSESGQGGMQDDAFDASGDMTVDFGFAPNVSIGSTVFVDFNDNGMQDVDVANGPTDEPGVPNVTIQLYFDADGDGVLTGTETTPVRTTMTDSEGNYYFGNLSPGNYQVQIPTNDFAGGGSLEFLPNSSTDIVTTPFDNDVDGDDNGLQTGAATVIVSPFIQLAPATEPNSDEETFQGGDPDDQLDANGNMTIDFGLICNLEIEINGPLTTCSNRQLDIRPGATIIPANVNGSWVTSGDGTFFDAAGNEIILTARYDRTAFYLPGELDKENGSVQLTVTTDAAGLCPPVSAVLEVVVLKVDCGALPWDGN